MEKEKTNKGMVTLALFIATFLSAVEGTIVSTAMPTIVGDLEGISIMNWVFSIFLLTSTLTTPIYGKLADNIGRKPIFIAGLVIFLTGSVLSGFSGSMPQLIIWRAIQGIGAGLFYQFQIRLLQIFIHLKDVPKLWESIIQPGE